jgi:hypothetical protein
MNIWKFTWGAAGYSFFFKRFTQKKEESIQLVLLLT